jgi:hypothetical protein
MVSQSHAVNIWLDLIQLLFSGQQAKPMVEPPAMPTKLESSRDRAATPSKRVSFMANNLTQEVDRDEEEEEEVR